MSVGQVIGIGIVFLLILAVLLMSVWFYWLSNVLLDEEEGKTAFFSYRSWWGIVDGRSLRGPFFVLRLYDEFLVVSTWDSWIIPYEQVTNMVAQDGFYGYLRVETDGKDVPSRFWFRVREAEKVKGMIEMRRG